MNFFTPSFNALQKVFAQNPITFLSSVILIGIFVWLYKEINNYITHDNEQQITSINHKLEIFGGLEMNIMFYLKKPSEEGEIILYETIGKSLPYVSDYIYKKINDLDHDTMNREELLRVVLSLLREETLLLRQKQLQFDSNVNKQTFLGYTEYILFNLSKRIFERVSVTIAVFLITIFLILWLAVTIIDSSNGMKWLFIGLLLMFWGLSSLIIYGLIMDQRYKHSIFNWLMNVLIFIIPILFVIITWIWFYVGLIGIALQIMLLLYLMPRMRKK